MKLGLQILAALWLLSLAGHSSDLQAWRAIVPLESTRADVTGLLGPPTRVWGAFAEYASDSAAITFEYSRAATDDQVCGARLSEGTVLSIRWTPKRPVPEHKLAKELGGLKRSRVTREEFSAFEMLYDEHRGIVAQAIDDEVEWILYLAPLKVRGQCDALYSRDPLDYFDPPHAGHIYPDCVVETDKTEVTVGDRVKITVRQVNPSFEGTLSYSYVMPGGRIIGSGASVTWETTGLAPGSYSIIALVSDGLNPPREYAASIFIRPARVP